MERRLLEEPPAGAAWVRASRCPGARCHRADSSPTVGGLLLRRVGTAVSVCASVSACPLQRTKHTHAACISAAATADPPDHIDILVRTAHRRCRLPYGNGGDCPMRTTPHRVPPCEELDLPIVLFVLRKITKTAAIRAALFDSNMHQIVCRLGLRTRPHWGA